MSYCDIILIVRGYRKRNILQYQLQRIQAFCSLYAFRGNETNKTPDQLWPLYFDKAQDEDPQVTEEEAKQMREEMKNFAQFLKNKNKTPE